MANRNFGILCIDPGTPFGWAFFTANFVAAYHSCGVCKMREQTWEGRSAEAAVELDRVIAALSPHVIYCEHPTYMPGRAAAAKGSLVKLCLTTGQFMRVAHERKVDWEFIEVADWMGQLNDTAIRHRAMQVFGKAICDLIPSHAIDAACIGAHVFGQWPKDGFTI